MGIFLKDPAAALDYAVEWSAAYLEAATIATSSWRVDPDEPSGLAVSASLTGPTRTGVTLGGGVPGIVYRVVNAVVLSDGRRDERTLILRVENR